jgi:hypothetical protein
MGHAVLQQSGADIGVFNGCDGRGEPEGSSDSLSDNILGPRSWSWNLGAGTLCAATLRGAGAGVRQVGQDLEPGARPLLPGHLVPERHGAPGHLAPRKRRQAGASPVVLRL